MISQNTKVRSVKIVAVMSAMLLSLMACEATSVAVVDTPSIDQTLSDGRVINVSRRASTTVTMSSLTTAEPNSSEIELFVVANNARSAPFTFSTDSIRVTIDAAPASVFTYEQLRAAEVRQRNIALIATAIGGAAEYFGASLPQTTTGAYNYGGRMARDHEAGCNRRADISRQPT